MISPVLVLSATYGLRSLSVNTVSVISVPSKNNGDCTSYSAISTSLVSTISIVYIGSNTNLSLTITTTRYVLDKLGSASSVSVKLPEYNFTSEPSVESYSTLNLNEFVSKSTKLSAPSKSISVVILSPYWSTG